MKQRLFFTLLFATAATGCGRSGLLDGAQRDAGQGEVEAPDAGTTDAGGSDAGGSNPGMPPRCPPAAAGTGRAWGTTPLGLVELGFTWTGTEPPGSHSCPHVSAVFSSVPEYGQPNVSIDLLFGKPPQLGPVEGTAVVTLDGKRAELRVRAEVLRADGLTNPTSPSTGWKTSITFAAAPDAGFTLQGVVTDAPDCSGATWFCL